LFGAWAEGGGGVMEEKVAEQVRAGGRTVYGTLLLEVAEELVDRSLEWSGPVRFRFVRLDDGRVELWFRNAGEWES
jgi:hypothetical protein